MEKQITNKIIKVDDILHIATMVEQRSEFFRNAISEEEIKYNEAKNKDEYYTKKLIEANIRYSICFDNNETISKTDEFEWFRNALSSNTKKIKEITINYNAYMDDKSENVSVEFYPKRVHLSSYSRDTQENEIAHSVENYFGSLPPRFDDLVTKDGRRKILPALSMSLILGILGSVIFFVLYKLNIITLDLDKMIISLISAGILVGVAFFGALLLPTQNHSLYRENIKFEKYYAGHDDQYNSIYKNDYAQYKNECEVCIGENADMSKVREKIESNYSKSKKFVLVELVISVVAIVLFVIL